MEQSAAEKSGVQVIARAVAMLRVVAQHPEGLTLTEIAAQLDLPRSTVQRIGGALVDEEMLIRAGLRAGFRLGPSLARLAGAAVTDAERVVRPVLEALSAATRETVDLSVLRGDRALFVDQVRGTGRLIAASAVGTSFPLYPTANGKALLGRLRRAQRDALIPAVLEPCTANTVTDRDRLHDAIDEAARSGVAWDLEEHAEGVCAVGAVFTSRTGRHFAVSIPVPTARFMATRTDLERALRGAMADIAALDP